MYWIEHVGLIAILADIQDVELMGDEGYGFDSPGVLFSCIRVVTRRTGLPHVQLIEYIKYFCDYWGLLGS